VTHIIISIKSFWNQIAWPFCTGCW